MTKRKGDKPEQPSRRSLEQLKERFKSPEIGEHGPPAAEDNPRRKWRPSGRKNWRDNQLED